MHRLLLARALVLASVIALGGPAGAVTWNQRSTATDATCAANIVSTISAADPARVSDFQDQLDLNTGAGTTLTVSVPGIVAAQNAYDPFVTAAGDPNNAAWQSGTVTVKINVTTAAVAPVTVSAQIARLDSTCSTLSDAQTAVTFDPTTTGVKTLTFNPTWTAGTTGDRFVLWINANRAVNGSSSFAVTVNDATNDTVATPITQGGGGGACTPTMTMMGVEKC